MGAAPIWGSVAFATCPPKWRCRSSGRPLSPIRPLRGRPLPHLPGTPPLGLIRGHEPDLDAFAKHFGDAPQHGQRMPLVIGVFETAHYGSWRERKSTRLNSSHLG